MQKLSQEKKKNQIIRLLKLEILKSKQLSTRLSGSYVISGSTQNLIGQTTIEGQTTISGSAILKGPSVDLNIRQNDNTNLVRLLTTTGGTSALQLYDNFNHGSVLKTVEINTSDQNALIISSGSATILNLDIHIGLEMDISYDDGYGCWLHYTIARVESFDFFGFLEENFYFFKFFESSAQNLLLTK